MKLAQALRRSDLGTLLRRTYWRTRGRMEFALYDDRSFIARHYEKSAGRTLDLAEPLRFTEKLQWLKLFYRDERMRPCSDKYLVREYVSEMGFADLLNTTLGVYERVSDFKHDLDFLPNRFVLKATHGSGWNLIVRDKAQVNWNIWSRVMQVWLTTDLSWFGREWNYSGLQPRLVVEEYLEDDSGELRDYKIMCLNGKPVWMQLDEHRSSNPRRRYVDPEGRVIPMADRSLKSRAGAKPDVVSVSFADVHRQMFDIAAQLSKPFPCVRVDFYSHEGRIVFGELTFFDGSGFYALEPEVYDVMFGAQLALPAPNWNLELLNEVRSSKRG